MAFLSEIKGFADIRRLKKVETVVTTPAGQQFTESRTATGDVIRKPKPQSVPGFCLDLKPDRTVGIATSGLLVSAADVAYDLSKLQELGVTHVLNLVAGMRNPFPEEFQYLSVEMYDDDQESLMAHYPQCQEFIDKARASGGTALVHCNAGRSRSVSIAMLYVMHREGLLLDLALTQLRQTRPQADPNPSFLRQLRATETKLAIHPSDD